MAEKRIPTFIPGDEIVYRVTFTCKVNVVFVSAAFCNETTGGEIILEGAADMVAQPRVRGARTYTATLYEQNAQEIVEEEVHEEEIVNEEVVEEVIYEEVVLDGGPSDEPETGRYRLARLTAETYSGKILDFDTPPEDAFRFEQEPEDVDLPCIARGIVKPASCFLLPDGHPNSPPPR